jgi:hypothetical protein
MYKAKMNFYHERKRDTARALYLQLAVQLPYVQHKFVIQMRHRVTITNVTIFLSLLNHGMPYPTSIFLIRQADLEEV